MIVCIISTLSLIAQKAAKSAYAELGGAGLASINYDMRLLKKQDGIGFRVGVGGFSATFSSDDSYSSSNKTGILTVPLEINYLLGKNEKNYFEFGAGATIVSVRNKFNYNPTNKFDGTFGHLYLGYRLQPKEGGFLFRAGITPIIYKNIFFPYWGGISFGYAFK